MHLLESRYISSSVTDKYLTENASFRSEKGQSEWVAITAIYGTATAACFCRSYV